MNKNFVKKKYIFERAKPQKIRNNAQHIETNTDIYFFNSSQNIKNTTQFKKKINKTTTLEYFKNRA